MFMNPHGGLQLGSLMGRWQIHHQPPGWGEASRDIFGAYNQNIPLSMNVPNGTEFSIVMKAGTTVISNEQGVIGFGFDTYPAQFVDHSGNISPSGIPADLQNLQFYETVLIVREQAYYAARPPITVEISFAQNGQTYTRKYDLKLKQDNIFSPDRNELVDDLEGAGVKFVPEFKGWKGWQSIRGEYIYNISQPIPAQMTFNGYWVLLLSNRTEAQLTFPALVPLHKSHGMQYTNSGVVTASLDLSLAGLNAIANKLTFPAAKLQSVRIDRDLWYYLLPTSYGTYVFGETSSNGLWQVYFVEKGISTNDFIRLMDKQKKTFLNALHDYNGDALGFHRVVLDNLSFWLVLKVETPTPAAGGTFQNEIEVEFLNGLLDFIIQRPLWWKRIGAFPVT